MCFHAKIAKKIADIEKHMNLTKSVGKSSFVGELTYYHANGFNHPNMWVVPQQKPNIITPMKWGLIPDYKKGVNPNEYYKETIRYGSGLNAKSEKLFSSNHYKNSAFSQRCIIPVDGFYEPHTTSTNFKIPFFFERKDKELLYLAGIYTISTSNIPTFSILTKEATPLFAQIHNSKKRRTVIINDDTVSLWLNDTISENDITELITHDMLDSQLNAYPISKDLFSPKVDSNRKNITDRKHYNELELNIE